ncbi:sugar transferase [Lentibacter sp. XHP0401]|uniref:sugar transferase n=1 Tax=Lentibacter sp. XHP0401 TaxID=2984334 RepID=UPI0021E94F3C|nr:sugar transferase [Lentibacter sp. XHP0401]MCV2893401.1 sugar transferase [Lentibacter sp. XHP0401]
MNERVSSRLDMAELRKLLESTSVPRSAGLYRGHGKRALDLVLVIVSLVPALLILLPLMGLIALDGRAPIYTQKRIGKNGRLFRMVKLRTMVADADQILDAYLARNPEARAEWEETQKLKSDPRITLFGKILRKSSLDELPQLLNVLLGHMSIVGPRPMMVGQESIYPGRAYYEMRPGITGYWQISERNETSFPQRAEYDTAYYKDLSFGTDVKVILGTLRVVVSGTGY